jgi:hypothetical protein
MTEVLEAAMRLPHLCSSDGEFRLTARYWNGSIRIGIDGEAVTITVSDGLAAEASATTGDAPDEPGHFGFDGPQDVWDRLLAEMPEPGFNDVAPAQYNGMRRTGHRETYWQYFPAARRIIDLLRDEVNRSLTPAEASPAGERQAGS